MYTYKISTGTLYDLAMQVFGQGWAGQPPYKNDPNATDKSGQGPLPIGFYTIGTAYTHPHIGPLTMNLTPDPANDMKHRDLFRMHGASASDPQHSSEGCIIMPHDVRLAVANNLDREFKLQVVA